MIKNLGNRMETMQDSINKDLEELKTKHTKTNNTITEIKILWKESIAGYLKQKNNQLAGRLNGGNNF